MYCQRLCILQHHGPIDIGLLLLLLDRHGIHCPRSTEGYALGQQLHVGFSIGVQVCDTCVITFKAQLNGMERTCNKL